LLSCGGLVETYVSVTDKKSGSYKMMPTGFSCGRYFVLSKKSQQYFFIIFLFGEILMDVTIGL
jgi:hypothetical protein